jgi:hypothetical protein
MTDAMDEERSELLDLEALPIPVDLIHLDPNNPRLVRSPASGNNGDRVSDEVAVDAGVQSDLLDQLRREEEVQALVTRIRQVGFVPIDRIVVRRLAGKPDEYLVLEGNRRIAALKAIRGNRAQFLSLPRRIQESIDTIQVLLYAGDDPEVAWHIQGFRNVGGGIRDWKPLQKARYIVDLMTRQSMTATQVAEITGLSAQAVNKFVRSFYGYTQALTDEEWGDLEPSDFAIFNEAVFARRNSPLWTWLEWNDSERRFENPGRLSELLRLLRERDDEGNTRIPRVNPHLRDYFSRLLSPDHRDLLDALLAGEIDLERAYAQATRNEAEEETRSEAIDLDSHLRQIRQAREDALTLPIVLIHREGRQEEFVRELAELDESIEAAIKDLG